ncbi:MAG: hypothetical protein ACFFA4_05340 [Promethearchaeota archaeon]
MIIRLEYGIFIFHPQFIEIYLPKISVQEVGFEPTNLGRGSNSFEDLCH